MPSSSVLIKSIRASIGATIPGRNDEAAASIAAGARQAAEKYLSGSLTVYMCQLRVAFKHEVSRL